MRRLTLAAVAVLSVLACTSVAPATPGASAPVVLPSVSPLASAFASALATPATTAAATNGVPATPPQTTVPGTPGAETPTPVATAPATLTPPTASGPLAIDWQRVANPGIGPAEQMTASAAAGGRFVVVGEDQNVNAAIWTSGDGRTWSPAVLPTGLGFVDLYDATANGNGFLAVGEADNNGSQTAIVLASSDGLSWQVANDATLDGWSYRNAASVGSTIVIAGPGGASQSAQWGFVVSHDGGTTWHLAADSSAIANVGLLSLVATSDAFWAFAPASGAKQAPIETWRSTDGETWTSVGTVAGSGGAFSLQVAPGPLGWVALATTTQHQKDVTLGWWSADAVNWQASQNPPFAYSDVFADDVGFIVVGKWLPKPSGCAIDPAEYAGVSWTSTDGLLWTRMPDAGWQSRWIDQLRRFNRTLIGIGIDYSSASDQGVGAVWTAKLPSIAENKGPVPTNPPPPSNGGC